jgi:hypothetical protein
MAHQPGGLSLPPQAPLKLQDQMLATLLSRNRDDMVVRVNHVSLTFCLDPSHLMSLADSEGRAPSRVEYLSLYTGVTFNVYVFCCL